MSEASGNSADGARRNETPSRERHPLTRIVMIVSYIAALIFLGLAYVPDPSIIGITSEPSRIMFYGLSGLFFQQPIARPLYGW